MKLVLKIAYNGAEFAGYQYQPDKRTVQGTLTRAISDTLGFECSVTGCSRTDAGVHSLGFVAAAEPKEKACDDWLRVPIGKFHRSAARFLPDDVSIVGEAAADDDFHPRYSAISKEYVYRIYDSPAQDPFLSKRAWHLKTPLDDGKIALMNKLAQELVGEHDFTSFMATGSKITDARREIYSCEVKKDGGIITLRVSANGFLYNMVRIITGTLVDLANGGASEGEIRKILAKCNRSAAGRTAPPDGLYLSNVRYEKEIPWTLL